jgi:phosphate-selective porin OprO/OprP
MSPGLLLVVLAAVPSPELDGGAPPEAPITAKFGEGVTFRAGDVKLNVRGRVQVQALSVFPTEGSVVARQNALMVRRARLTLKGEFPWHLSMNLQLAFASQDMEADAPNVLRDFNVQWAPLRDLSFRLGQMKVPFDVQRVVSSSSLQFVDRSTATAELNLDRDVGLVAYSDDLFGLGDRLRYAVGVFGGDGRNRLGTNVGLLYAGRLRYSVFGKFDDKFEGDPERSAKPRLAFGVGGARNVQTNRPRSTTGTPYTGAVFDYWHATGDLHFKWHGVSLLSELYWRQADEDSRTTLVKGATVTESSRSGWGWFVQGGVYVTDWLELGARWADTRPLGATDPNFRRVTELAGVVNLMLLKHDLKLQTDFAWLDEAGHGRLQLRIQAQVFF